MIIETKWSINKEYWVLHDNKVQKMQVTEVRVIVRNGMTNEVMYFLNNSSAHYSEADIFETKEALLQSL